MTLLLFFDKYAINQAKLREKKHLKWRPCNSSNYSDYFNRLVGQQYNTPIAVKKNLIVQ